MNRKLLIRIGLIAAKRLNVDTDAEIFFVDSNIVLDTHQGPPHPDPMYLNVVEETVTLQRWWDGDEKFDIGCTKDRTRLYVRVDR